MATAAAAVAVASQTLPALRLVTVRGAAGLTELGRALGREYGPTIAAGRERWRNYYVDQEKTTTEEQLLEFTTLATAGTRACCPHATAFLDGLSEGTGLDMFRSMLDFELETWDHIVTVRKKQEKAAQRAKKVIEAVNVTSAPIPHGHCTGLTFASAVDPDYAMLAQTVELPLKLYGQGDADVVLHLEWGPAEAPHRALCYDTDGRCCPAGFNSAGLAVGIFSLRQRQESGYTRPAVPIQALQWELLLGQYTMASGLAFLRALSHPVMSGAALLLADKSGAAANVELNPDGVFIDGPHADRLLRRSNHPLLSGALEHNSNTAPEQKYSELRLKQLDALLKNQAKKAKDKEGIERLRVGPANALAALCGSDLICNTRALAVVVSDLATSRLFCLFKERWTTTGTEKHRVQTGKAQVHKVRRKLYVYDLDDIAACQTDEAMDQDLEALEDGSDTDSTSSTGSSSSNISSTASGDEDEDDDEEEEGGEAQATLAGNVPEAMNGEPNPTADGSKASGSRSHHPRREPHSSTHCHHRAAHSGGQAPAAATDSGGPEAPVAMTTLVPRKRKPSSSAE